MSPQVESPELHQQICIACQLCCRHLTFVVPEEVLEDFGEFYKVRGATIIKGDIMNRYGQVALRVPSDCQHIDHYVGCKIYGKRPQYCRTYDGRRDLFMKEICKLPEKGE